MDCLLDNFANNSLGAVIFNLKVVLSTRKVLLCNRCGSGRRLTRKKLSYLRFVVTQIRGEKLQDDEARYHASEFIQDVTWRSHVLIFNGQKSQTIAYCMCLTVMTLPTVWRVLQWFSATPVPVLPTPIMMICMYTASNAGDFQFHPLSS